MKPGMYRTRREATDKLVPICALTALIWTALIIAGLATCARQAEPVRMPWSAAR